MRERVARAMCVAGSFDPNEIMSNDGPRWKYYAESADAAIAVVIEECAKVAESIISADQYDTMDTDCHQDTANRIAEAIRALAD